MTNKQRIIKALKFIISVMEELPQENYDEYWSLADKYREVVDKRIKEFVETLEVELKKLEGVDY